MRKMLRKGAVLTALALVAVGCGGGEDGGGGGGGTATGSPQVGGILRIGSTGGIDSLNPWKAWLSDAYSTFVTIYPMLVQYDGDLNIVPDFGTSWEMSSDNTVLTFTTASGGTWSDGQPLTARDAAYTMNLMFKYPGPTSMLAGYMKHITSVEAPDDNTLVITYEVPVNLDWALSQVNSIYIVPEHVWSQHEGNDGKDLKLFTNDAPVVSGGPFALQAYAKNDYAQFVVNPGFYGPKPLIDGFGIKWYSNDDAMVTAFQNGELDFITMVPSQAIETVSSNPNLVVDEVPGLMWYDVIFNSHKPLHAEILDPKVREAFAHAIDYQRIVDTVILGNGSVGTTIVPPSTPKWHDASIEQYTFDTTLANQILDDAGYAKGSDGIRVANGRPMEYEVVVPTNLDGGDRTFEIVQSGLAEIGVKVTQKALDSSAAWAELTGTDGNGYDQYDLAIWDWVAMVDPDFILSVLTCEQMGGWSDTGYCNKEYDQLYSDQGTATTTEERQQIVNQMQRIIYDDLPYIVLYYHDLVEAHAKNWDRFVVTPQGSWNSLSKLTLEQVHQVG